MLTQERLKQLVTYNPETGIFNRTISTNGRMKIGEIAGHTNKKGYVIIKVDGNAYKAHRLAFLYMTGYFPENQIDHKNRIKNCNIWKNLRPATNSENAKNRNRKSGASGLKGVSWHIQHKKWSSTIMVNGKQHHLGYFADPCSAHKAYLESSKILHGDFSVFNAIDSVLSHPRE